MISGVVVFSQSLRAVCAVRLQVCRSKGLNKHVDLVIGDVFIHFVESLLVPYLSILLSITDQYILILTQAWLLLLALRLL